MAQQPRHVAGFSLVELMVSLVVALVVMLGALRVFVGVRESIRLEDGLSRLQENIRYATEAIALDVRMAGFSGCVGSTYSNKPAINSLLNPSGADYEPAFYDLERPVTGFEYAHTGPQNTYTATATAPVGAARGNWSDNLGAQLPNRLANLVQPGTDVLIVKRADQRQKVTSKGSASQQSESIDLTGPIALALNPPPSCWWPIAAAVICFKTSAATRLN